MIEEKKKNLTNMEIRKVIIVCPHCEKKKEINIPTQIINDSKQLTTVSIPKTLICEHTFQIFIDKNFKVRGYQKVDFELEKIDFYYNLGKLETPEEILEKKESPQLKIVCPKCKRVLNIDVPLNEDNVSSFITFSIDSKVENHCGHEFLVYIDKSKTILGYSNIKNVNENEELKDIFSKL